MAAMFETRAVLVFSASTVIVKYILSFENLLDLEQKTRQKAGLQLLATLHAHFYDVSEKRLYIVK